MTIAFIRSVFGAFVSGGADVVGDFELDQLLHHETHGVADQIDAVAGAERVEKFGQGMLTHGGPPKTHHAKGLKPHAWHIHEEQHERMLPIGIGMDNESGHRWVRRAVRSGGIAEPGSCLQPASSGAMTS